MNERELRLLHGIRESLVAIQKEISAIRTEQERQSQQYHIQPLWLDPILTERKQSEANTTSSNDRHYRVQNSLKRATWCAFIAATVYAGIAGYQLSEIHQQTAIAEQQSRPWVKITEATLNSPETLTYHTTLMGTWTIHPNETLMFFAATKPSVALANIRTTLHLKNIGKSVAHNIRVVAELFFATSVYGSITKEQDRFCNLVDFNKRLDTPVSRSALFPDDAFTADINAFGGIAKDDITQRDGVDWVRPVLIGCAIYQFPRNFQTRIAYIVGGLETGDVRLGIPLTAEQIKFTRDEHSEYAQ
jgi:hypothetical protein